MNQNVAATWQGYISFWQSQYKALAATGGEDWRFSTSRLARDTGPHGQRVQEYIPKARFVSYVPVSDENIYQGVKLATGTSLHPHTRSRKRR